MCKALSAISITFETFVKVSTRGIEIGKIKIIVKIESMTPVLQPILNTSLDFFTFPVPIFMLIIEETVVPIEDGKIKQIALMLEAIPCAFKAIAPNFSISLFIRKNPRYRKA